MADQATCTCGRAWPNADLARARQLLEVRGNSQSQQEHRDAGNRDAAANHGNHGATGGETANSGTTQKTVAEMIKDLQDRAKQDGMEVSGLAELKAPSQATPPPKTIWEAQQLANRKYRDVMGRLATARQHGTRLASGQAGMRTRLEAKAVELTAQQGRIRALEVEALAASTQMAFPTPVPQPKPEEGAGKEPATKGTGKGKGKDKSDEDGADTPEMEEHWKKVLLTMKQCAKDHAAIKEEIGGQIDPNSEGGKQLAANAIDLMNAALQPCIDLYQADIRGSTKRKPGSEEQKPPEGAAPAATAAAAATPAAPAAATAAAVPQQQQTTPDKEPARHPLLEPLAPQTEATAATPPDTAPATSSTTGAEAVPPKPEAAAKRAPRTRRASKTRAAAEDVAIHTDDVIDPEGDDAMQEVGAEGAALSPTTSPARKKQFAEQQEADLRREAELYHQNLEDVAAGREPATSQERCG